MIYTYVLQKKIHIYLLIKIGLVNAKQESIIYYSPWLIKILKSHSFKV